MKRYKIRAKYYVVKRWWWKLMGVTVGPFASIFSQFGKGKFVSVHKKYGGIVDIVSHTKYPFAPKGTIRIIPYQPNHGLMIEFRDENGTHKWRDHLDYQAIYNLHQGEKHD